MSASDQSMKSLKIFGNIYNVYKKLVIIGFCNQQNLPDLVEGKTC